MRKLKQAQAILAGLGLPPAQCNEISGFTLLALCGIRRRDSWSKASRASLTITKGIMAFIDREYGRKYAPNTRETFRRQVLHQFVQGRVADYNPDDPALSTNSPRAHYAITEAALAVLKAYGNPGWEPACREFAAQHGSLVAIYRDERRSNLVPVRLSDGRTLTLSPGKHNLVQAAVIEQFAPRFASDSVVAYLGDTANKSLHVDHDLLARLGIRIADHDKLPDVVLYDQSRNWLYLVEAVTSHGPMTPKRVIELRAMLESCEAGVVFVTAFPDFTEFRKHISKIAWDTEVWVAEIPDHVIHYNGDRFLSPR
ncbi:MAG: BsuBI/PstI family type II restriction endonuclease [Planctomycetaceae bacterium]